MGHYFVGIDSGTQSVRVIVFDLQGRVAAQASEKHARLTTPFPGSAELDAEDLWTCLCRASRRAVSMLHNPREIEAVCLAAQRSVLISVNEQGIPLHPGFSWLDSRRTDEIPALAGINSKLREMQVCSKANWMKNHMPELYRKTSKFLSASGWLTYKLCGLFRDSVGGLGGIFPLDVSCLDWSEDPLLYDLIGIPRTRLPDVFQPGQLIGSITHEAARETGLPEGIALVTGSGDKSCEMLGAGVTSPKQGYISYGTLATLEIPSPVPVFSKEGLYWTIPGAVPGTWNFEYGINYGFLLVSWFCEQFEVPEVGKDAATGRTLEEICCDQAASVPPVSGGLFLETSQFGPSRLKDVKETLLNLTNDIPHPRVLRMILEGFAFGMREGLELLARDAEVSLEKIFIGGGGAQGELPVQITADVLGLPVTRPRSVQTCTLGAAVLAALGAGFYSSCEEAAAQMCQRERVFHPDPTNCRIYDSIYKGRRPTSPVEV
ncbi:MAG: hypothetical protein EHM41_10130 [Chloroflexi bacterium]|nr:MAG: hypothetical protein EHM41_10130 [Chloroflexota bacterium]